MTAFDVSVAVTHFTWYSVEFVFMLSVIAYVCYTFKLFGHAANQEAGVAATDIWAKSGEILTGGAQFVGKLNAAFRGQLKTPEAEAAAAPKPEPAK